jgi:glycosyltransferase involved in cell wall biosynthesis
MPLKTNTNPKVSLIILCYNLELFIEKCILSAVNQTYKEIEILVIDDGSKDNSNKVIESISRKYENIKHVKKENEGCNKARETALQHATGDYIYFLDGDDFIELETIESLVNTMIEKSADIVVSNKKTFDYPSKQTVSHPDHNVKEEIIDGKTYLFRILGDGTHHLIAKLYKKELFNDCLFYKINSSEDLITSIQLAYFADKVFCSNTYYYNYVVNRPGSIMSSAKNNRYIDNFKARFIVFEFLEQKTTSNDEEQRLVEFVSRANYVFLYKSSLFSSLFKNEIYQMGGYLTSKLNKIQTKQMKIFLSLLKINKNIAQVFVKLVQKHNKTISSWE